MVSLNVILNLDDSVAESVRAIMGIARDTLVQYGTHLPTVIFHTMEGLLPVILPFKDEGQRKALSEYVKKRAVELHAVALTTVTCARIVDHRSGTHEECIVAATTIQRGRPYVVRQSFSRDETDAVVAFGDMIEGEDAIMPGQMLIFPDWDDETFH